ncbi:hypothetical protein ACPCIU_07515 [Streptomyces seoulensis]|uniref:hypothetical protein n=1 Tax=Streptomyces seoulensis TaxID=73044 RepID=UPI003C2BE7AB
MGGFAVDGEGASVVISVAAVVISVLSLYVARLRDRRDALLKLHESLITPELQHGRRAVFLAYRDGQTAGLPIWPRFRSLADRAEAYLRARGVDVAPLTGPAPGVPESRTEPS